MGTPSWWSTVTSRGEAHVADLNGRRKHAHVRRYFRCTLSTTQTLAMEQTFEHDADLSSCQVRAKTEMGTRSTETDMFVRGPQDIETMRGLEYGLVPVARVVPEDHLIPFLQLLIAQDRVLHAAPPHENDRRRPTYDLLDRRRRHADL